jgi:hypothetical protein
MPMTVGEWDQYQGVENKNFLIFPNNEELHIKFLHQQNGHINHWLGKADAVYPKPLGKGKVGVFQGNYTFEDIPEEERTRQISSSDALNQTTVGKAQSVGAADAQSFGAADASSISNKNATQVVGTKVAGTEDADKAADAQSFGAADASNSSNTNATQVVGTKVADTEDEPKSGEDTTSSASAKSSWWNPFQTAEDK